MQIDLRLGLSRPMDSRGGIFFLDSEGTKMFINWCITQFLEQLTLIYQHLMGLSIELFMYLLLRMTCVSNVFIIILLALNAVLECRLHLRYLMVTESMAR
jgi:hypothetical protein